MRPPERPANEQQRLELLRALEALDQPPDDELDELTKLAAEICGTPVALVSLVDEQRQWFASNVGLAASETQRDVAFCAHAILQEEVFEISDANTDLRFADNPLVTGAPFIRFYAGAPLASSHGLNLGTVCVIDTVPRTLSPTQRHCLRVLAKSAMRTLELRAATRALTKAVSAEREAVARKSWLSAYVAHEIRNLLTVTGGLLDLLERTPLDPTQQQFLAGAQSGTWSMTRLVNDVLALTKANTLKPTLRNEPFELAGLVETLRREYEPLASARGLQFEVTVADGVATRLTGDVSRVAQVLHNLIGNALKFTRAGHIRVEIEQASPGQVRFTVEDTGPGLSQEERGRLFRVYSGEQSGSSGLGLYITQELLELMSGQMEVSSEPGEGSVFSFVLPLGDASPVPLTDPR